MTRSIPERTGRVSKLRLFARLLPGLAATSVLTAAASDSDEALWQETYSARETFYASQFGPLPGDILNFGHMYVVWPGGGLFVIPTERLGDRLWVYTSFGLTNPDMPASTAPVDPSVTSDETQSSGTLAEKALADPPAGAAGYGYELLILAREDAQWPLWVMQWAVNAEIIHDAGILDRVERNDGLTVQGVMISETEAVNVLIAAARDPLPSGGTLPNGNFRLLVATVITDDELTWSMDNGRGALLDRLIENGVGQVSVPGRAGVVD